MHKRQNFSNKQVYNTINNHKKTTLLKHPKCYTDVCIDGKWFHYDHCGTHVYMLKGGAQAQFELSVEPSTEIELIKQIKQLTCFW